ncbi:hypothetical protein PG988_010785 [Apiospora saccharicola]
MAPQRVLGSTIRGWKDEILRECGFTVEPLVAAIRSRIGDIRAQGLPTYQTTYRPNQGLELHSVAPWKLLTPARSLHPWVLGTPITVRADGLRGWVSPQGVNESKDGVINHPDAVYPGPSLMLRLMLPRQTPGAVLALGPSSAIDH